MRIFPAAALRSARDKRGSMHDERRQGGACEHLCDYLGVGGPNPVKTASLGVTTTVSIAERGSFRPLLVPRLAPGFGPGGPLDCALQPLLPSWQGCASLPRTVAAGAAALFVHLTACLRYPRCQQYSGATACLALQAKRAALSSAS